MSPLDSLSVRYFNAFDDELARKNRESLFLFSGHDIERWMLKVLCGMCASNNAPAAASHPLPAPPAKWIEILFGEADFTGWQGLYVCRLAHLNGIHGCGAQPVYEGGQLEGDEIKGLTLFLKGFATLLWMDPERPAELPGRPRLPADRIAYDKQGIREKPVAVMERAAWLGRNPLFS